MIGRAAGPFGGGNALPIFFLILLAYAFLTGGVASPIRNAAQDPVGFVGFIVAIALGITVHEFMHAYVAHRFGDDTARLLGRMSLDPRAHLDMFGSLLIVFFGFGYGKPVPVNEGRVAGGRGALALVSVAGPLTNVVLAAVSAIPLRTGASEVFGGTYERVLVLIVLYNCLLAIFNLVPLPPLDGSKVVYALLPQRQAYSWRAAMDQYGPFILLAVIFLLPYFRIDLLGPLVIRPGCGLAALLAGLRSC